MTALVALVTAGSRGTGAATALLTAQKGYAVAVNYTRNSLAADQVVRQIRVAGGSIVNVSSAASRLGGAGQYVDYAASKGAIDSFTIGLAKEVALEGIRFSAVRPGIIETDIHASGDQPERARQMAPQVPMQRAGTALEVAQAIVWLMGHESSYTTGTLVDVTGGR